jgi:subtilisin family serine protease
MPWIDNSAWDDAIERDQNVAIDPTRGFAYRPTHVVVPETVWDPARRSGRGQAVFEQLRRAGAEPIAGITTEPRGERKATTAARFGLRFVRVADPAAVPAIVEGARDEGVAYNHVLFADPQRHGGCAPPQLLSAALESATPADAGVGKSVAVLDTGMAASRPVEVDGDLQPDQIEPDAPAGPAHGHGTMVAGVVQRNAPGARILVRRVLDQLGVVDELDVALALADLPQVAVINLSFGGRAADADAMVVLRAAVEDLPEETLVVASAGNEGEREPHYPAAFERVLSVAAAWKVDNDRWALEPYSNRGDWVRACTRGTNVETVDREGRPVLCTGTSFAAPTIAGKVAALAAPVHTAEEANDQLAGQVSIPEAGPVVP